MVFSYNYGKQKTEGKNKCTSVAGHFDGHESELEQYRWHCLMRHVQGYPESHWTPTSGDYSLRIAPVAARATANKTAMKKWINFAGHFDGRRGWYHTACIS
jgi:hypothetical protein